MCKLPVGTQVESKHGQAGIVVRPQNQLWPTLTAVKWVGTSFVTYEDHHKLLVIELPAGDVVLTASSSVRRVPASQKRRDAAIDAHAALLERARQRGMVRA